MKVHTHYLDIQRGLVASTLSQVSLQKLLEPVSQSYRRPIG